jgi:hypothetical protein
LDRFKNTNVVFETVREINGGKMKVACRLSILLVSLLVGMPLMVHAQFGNLLKELQKLVPPNQSGGATGAAQPAPQARSRGGGLIPSDQWCSQQSGALGKMKVDTGVIVSEFNVAELEALQDHFLAALRKDKLSRTFPHARFFQSSFETSKVRGIYDSFLAFPEPESLAALIQISRSHDQQESADALMALTFLHLQAPELSVNRNRWFELHQKALRADHFTALVFRARIKAYGEYEAKDLAEALGDLVRAGDLRNKYEEDRKEWDSQNYALIHTNTAKDIFFNEPKMPYRQQWQGPAQMGLQIERAQQEFARQLPNTRIGRMYAKAEDLNKDSIEIGNSIIRITQSGNQTVGQIESQRALRDSAPGEKPVFADVSPEVHAAQMKIINSLPSVDGDQKKMLAQAQEKRLLAQGIISQSYAELLHMLMANFSGDIVRMAAPLPALTQAQNALIQSCIISAKWEQAMRAKDVPKVEPKRLESGVKDLSSQYKD